MGNKDSSDKSPAGEKQNRRKRFLVIRLDEIGDLLLTVPMMRELKKSFPGCTLDLIVKPGLSSWMEKTGIADRIFSAAVKRRDLLKNIFLFFQLFLLRLIHGKYDAVILPRTGCDRSCSRLCAFAAGGKTILAYRSSLHGIDSWIPTDLLEEETVLHSVLSSLRFVEVLGGKVESSALDWKDLLPGTLSENEPEWLKKIPLDREICAFCSPFSAQKIKNWSPEKYVRLISSFHRETGCKTFLLGAVAHQSEAEWICEHCIPGSCFSLCGQTALEDLPFILKRGSFYFGADTSITHFSAASGLPCVVLTPHAKGYSGVLSAQYRFHPWGVPYRIVYPPERVSPCTEECRGKSAHCIDLIRPEQVLQEILLLRKSVSG